MALRPQQIVAVDPITTRAHLPACTLLVMTGALLAHKKAAHQHLHAACSEVNAKQKNSSKAGQARRCAHCMQSHQRPPLLQSSMHPVDQTAGHYRGAKTPVQAVALVACFHM
jgi:hypothetical protein